MIKLHDFELSGNCYKLRLMMNILGIEYQTEPIDFCPGNEHKSERFLEINPLGQLPVLEDDGRVIRPSCDNIRPRMRYCASRHGLRQEA